MFTQLAVHTHRRQRTPPRRTPVPSPAPPPASPPPPARVSERRGERGSPSRQHPPRPTPARARSVPPCPALALQPRSSAYTETRQNTGRSSRLCLYGRDRRGAWRRGSRAPCPGRTTRVYATCSSPARSLTPFFSSPHYPISLRFQPCATLPPPFSHLSSPALSLICKPSPHLIAVSPPLTFHAVARLVLPSQSMLSRSTYAAHSRSSFLPSWSSLFMLLQNINTLLGSRPALDLMHT